MDLLDSQRTPEDHIFNVHHCFHRHSSDLFLTASIVRLLWLRSTVLLLCPNIYLLCHFSYLSPLKKMFREGVCNENNIYNVPMAFGNHTQLIWRRASFHLTFILTILFEGSRQYKVQSEDMTCDRCITEDLDLILRQSSLCFSHTLLPRYYLQTLGTR